MMKGHRKFTYLITTIALIGISLTGCRQAPEGAPNGPNESTRAEKVTPRPSAVGNAVNQLHEIMMRPMPDRKLSGNVDKDFATLMAVHHGQGIEMANLEVKQGRDPKMVQLAQRIVDKQTQERGQLSRIAQQLPDGSGKPTFSKRIQQAMERPMRAPMAMSGDFDKDFATMMALHHQGAINMARIEIKRGSNAELKKMAQQMITDQRKEKRQLLNKAGVTMQALMGRPNGKVGDKGAKAGGASNDDQDEMSGVE